MPKAGEYLFPEERILLLEQEERERRLFLLFLFQAMHVRWKTWDNEET